jgi:hypothetical protein
MRRPNVSGSSEGGVGRGGRSGMAWVGWGWDLWGPSASQDSQATRFIRLCGHGARCASTKGYVPRGHDIAYRVAAYT